MSESQPNIHPLALVEPGAQLGQGVVVEAFAVVKKHVTLHDRVVIRSHAYIDGHTTIGEGTVVYPGACIGIRTQSLKYEGEQTFVVIGKNCQIREYVTINSSTKDQPTVRIGDNCLIMAYCHVAHNCTVGNHVIMTNNSALAGHCVVEDYAIIGGFTPIHQFCRIGCHAMVGGMSRVGQDVPPYTVGGGIPYRLGGVNIVGLKRRGFPLETRTELWKAVKKVYRSGLSVEEALKELQAEKNLLPEVQHFVAFCQQSQRGLIGLEGSQSEEEQVAEEEVAGGG